MSRFAFFLMLIFFALAIAAGCANDDDDDTSDDDSDDDTTIDDDDDDDDDDTPLPPLDLQGVFVIPNYHYADTDAQVKKLVADIAAFGPDTLIWQWTLLYNKVCYPSDTFDELEGMVADDLIGAMLDEADRRGMSVYLGLSAGRRPAEQFSAPVDPEAERVTWLIDELAQRYGAHSSLRGFYIPYEFIGPPNDDETTLLTRIVLAARNALPGGQVLMTASYPGPPQVKYVGEILRNLDFHFRSQDDINDQEDRSLWAQKTIAAFDQAGIDGMLLKTMMGSRKNDRKEARFDFAAIVDEQNAQNAPVQIWAQTDLFDGMNPAGRMTPAPYAASSDFIDRQVALINEFGLPGIGFAYDHYLNGDGRLQPPRAGTDPLLYEKAMIIEQHLRSRTLRDGNVVTVIDAQVPLDAYSNLWQEDACWITGLYLGAESFRCAVTGEDDACDFAQKLWGVIHQMAYVTPLPGEVVRNYSRYLYTQTNPVQPGSSTIKRWHKHPDKELYWVGDISVDQLSGYFYGLAVFHDLVADPQQKAQVKQTIADVMGLIVDNGFRAYEFNGQNTTYGRLRAVPELALTWLPMAWRMTGQAKFLDAYDQMVFDENYHYKLTLVHYGMHFLKKYGGQHFQDTGLYHMYTYAPPDPKVFRELIWGMEYVYQGSFDWGNAMADFTHQNRNPDSAGAARSLHNHYMYNPYFLDNAVWAEEINHPVTQHYQPMDQRPFDEWDWTVAPGFPKDPRGGANHRYPGVSYLVTYWEGRWHGWIP